MAQRQLVEIVVDNEVQALTGNPEAYPQIGEGKPDITVPGGYYLNEKGEPINAKGILLSEVGKMAADEAELRNQVQLLEEQVQQETLTRADIQKELEVAKAELAKVQNSEEKKKIAELEKQLADAKTLLAKLAAEKKDA